MRVEGRGPIGTLGMLGLHLPTAFTLEVGVVAHLGRLVQVFNQVSNPGRASRGTQLMSLSGVEDHGVNGAALTPNLRLVTRDNALWDLFFTDLQTAVHHHLALSHLVADAEEQNREEDLGTVHGRHHDGSLIT